MDMLIIFCNFVRPGELVMAWTDNQNDPQYAISKEYMII